MLPLGTIAPHFFLPDTEGRPTTLQDAAGPTGVLVAFICNHCPYVKHIAPALAALASEFQARGVGVVAINANDAERYPDDSPERMRDFRTEAGFTFPYLFDRSQESARAYQAVCTPDFFLFDADLALVYRGQFDDSRPSSGAPVTGADLRAALEALVAGEPIPAEQRPSLGCSIKWRPGNEPSGG